MYLSSLFAALAVAAAGPAGEWTITSVSRAPWAIGSPDARWTGQHLAISGTEVHAAKPFGCSDARWEMVQVPAEGLFQGNLPPASAAQIARTLLISIPAKTYRLTCSSGSFDFHQAAGGLITALDNDLLKLQQHLARVGLNTAELRLTPSGLGPVRIGMTQKQVSKVLGTPLNHDDGALEIGEDCSEANASTLPGAWFMFEQGKLTRVSLRPPSTLMTLRGIAPGASEAIVRNAYASGLAASPHAYEAPPARYLTFWTGGRRTGVRFEINQRGFVEAVHAGTRSIEYVEGCA